MFQIHLKDLEDAFEIGIIQLFEVEGGDQIVNLKGEVKISIIS